MVWVGVALLGGVGACARHLLAAAIASRSFPLGILVVNVSGAFLLGLLVGADVTGDAYLLAGTATLGAYTTFSTWMLDTQRAAAAGHRGVAVANVLISLVLGLGAAALGRMLG